MLDSVSDTREGEIAGVKHYSNAAEKKLITYIYFLDIYLRMSECSYYYKCLVGTGSQFYNWGWMITLMESAAPATNWKPMPISSMGKW